MDSILLTVKKMLGVSDADHVFDIDMISHINSVFMVLHQLGIGPEETFFIEGEDEVWSDFLGDDGDFAAVKSYVSIKIKLMFDPPGNSFLVDNMSKMATELEWRLQVLADPSPYLEDEEELEGFEP